MRLRGHERLEDLVRLMCRQPDAGVADRHQHSLVVRSPRCDRELARPVHFLHGLDAVHDEVHHDLLQLHPIAHRLGQIGGQVRPDRYAVSHGFAAQQDDHLPDQVVHIHRRPFRCALLEEQENPADDFGRACSVLDDSHRRGTRLFDVRVVAAEPEHAGIGVGEGGSDRLIHFMRQRDRQLAHGGHPADVGEIRLRLTQGSFGLLALDGDARKMRDLLDDVVFVRRGRPRFAIVDREGSQHPAFR